MVATFVASNVELIKCFPGKTVGLLDMRPYFRISERPTVLVFDKKPRKYWLLPRSLSLILTESFMKATIEPVNVTPP